MAYLASIHRPSSVRHALKLNLLDQEEECLVIAKSNRLEIWTLKSDGLSMFHSQPILGSVSMLDRIRPPGAKMDHLFVGTQRFQYFTVAWNSSTRQLDTCQSFVDISEKHMRDSQSRDRCAVDPSGQHLILELFEGVLSLVKIIKPRKTPSYFDSPEQIRITELRVLAATFLHTSTKRPKYAMLYAAKRDEIRLVTYRVVDERGQYIQFNPKKDRETDIGDLDPGASHLIPVPKGDVDQKRYIVRNAASAKAQAGGVIVVGETKMTYLDDESKAIVECPLNEASIFVAWERYDDLRYLLADVYGRLHLLTILVDGAVVTGIDVRKIGHTSKATVLVHLQNGIVYVASHEGDNQIIRVHVTPDNQHVEVLQTLPNIAPVLDFTVMDMGSREGETQTNEYSSGQARVVTGSGVFQDGSLRSVRSGVGLEDIGILADTEDIRGLFSLRSCSTSQDDTTLVSFSTESRIFRFGAQGEIEEVDNYRGLSQDAETLLAMNLSNDVILQITASSATIFNTSGKSAQWRPPEGQIITAASANNYYALLAVNGRTLVSLDVRQLLTEVKVHSLGENDQVACIHVPMDLSAIGVVGLWKSGSVSILDLKGLEVLHSETLRRNDEASIPRNIALTQILHEDVHGPTLFVAMEDGIVLTFDVDKNNYSLSGRKSIVLGMQQARLEIIPRKDGLSNIFATCEHPSLIYGSEGKIVYSAVTAEDATCVCSFNSTAYPDCIILATSEHLKISQIDTERRTHVRTLPMGQTVRRIAYSAKERAFGIGCIQRDLIGSTEFTQSTFKLVDEVVFGELGQPYILNNSNQSEMVECIIRAEIPIQYGDGEPMERFLVGTAYLDESDGRDDNAIGGRLLIFGIENRSPYLIHSHSLKTACRQIGVLNGKIVAALIKTVVMYNYEETSESTAILTKTATYRPSVCPIDIAITGNIIAVADLMKSVALVEYKPGKDGLPDTFGEVARHYQAITATAVADIDEKEFLESDGEGNLIVLRRNPQGVTFEDRKRLEVTSELNLGEMVNRIRKINVDASPTAIVIPKAFLATTEGSIHLFSQITPAYQDLLMRLQARMASIVSTLGNLDFNTYRAFKNDLRETTEPFRFVDGELIERFLDVGEEMQGEICKGLGPGVEDLRSLVEELKRLH